MLEEDAHEAAMKEHFSQKPKVLRARRRYPSRDEMHRR
jgi:hypothetical protein